MRQSLLRFGAISTAVCLALATYAQDKSETKREAAFSLDGPRLYEAHRRASNLTVADFNGDGRLDLAVISNDEALLRLLIALEEPGEEGELFDEQELTLDRLVDSTAAADVNGDGRTDLILAGSGERVSVMYQNRDGRLQSPQETELEADYLTLGDLTGNDREELLLTHERTMRVLEAEARGLNLEPRETFHLQTAPPASPLILDLNGDGRNDIVWRSSESNEAIYVRLQSALGDFPDEVKLETGQLRSIDAVSVPKGRDILAAVHGKTRHLVALELEVEPEIEADELFPTSLPRVVGLSNETYDSDTFSVAADINGDARHDLVIASPRQALLRVAVQARTGALRPREVPALEDIREILVWPVEAGQPAPLLVLSPGERAIAVTRSEKDDPETLVFPRPLDLEGDPLAMTIVRLKDKKPALAVAAKREEGSEIGLYPDFVPFETPAPKCSSIFKIEEETDTPTGLKAVDFDSDGNDEIVLFFEYEKPRVLRLEGNTWKNLPLDGIFGGLLEDMTPGRIFQASLNGKDRSGVIAVKEQYARLFHLDKNGTIVIERQFNATESRPRLTDAEVGAFRGPESRDVVLLDSVNRKVLVYGPEEQGEPYELLAEVETGDGEFKSIEAMDLDGDGREDLVLVAPDRLTSIFTRRLLGGIQTVASAESPEEEGGYGLARAISLEAGAAEEIATVEMKVNALEFFRFSPATRRESASMESVYGFRVFDSESSVARRENLDAPPEPRELVSADLNGDGRADLAVLVHDYIIVYYQKKP